MISIITPVYNAIKYIDKTIDMVLAQDYTDWEWIIVEDGSTDGTRERLSELKASGALDKRICIILTDDNDHKAAGARNIGLAQAKGRYIAFLDADDVWMPGKLSRQLSFMEEKGAAFSFTAYEFGDSDAIGTGRFVRVPDRLSYRQALSRTIIFTSTVMCDTELLDKQLLYMPYIASEDTATWWRILKTGIDARGLDEPLTIYRRPGKSLSSNKFVALKRIWDLYRKQEGLGLIYSICNFIGWAVRATIRRI